MVGELSTVEIEASFEGRRNEAHQKAGADHLDRI